MEAKDEDGQTDLFQLGLDFRMSSLAPSRRVGPPRRIEDGDGSRFPFRRPRFGDGLRRGVCVDVAGRILFKPFPPPPGVGGGGGQGAASN